MNVAPPLIPTPLGVLTGFLGSGKTTLLNRLLSDPSMRDTAVIVNEFGAIGIDHLLVESVADDVVLLASGCVCCSAGDDLADALVSMLKRRADGVLPPFERIILETTGIADPGALLQLLLANEALAAEVRIQSIVTVVDGVSGIAAISRFSECASQVAMANRLLISKLDLVEQPQVDALMDLLQSMNRAAPILLLNRDEPVTLLRLFDVPDGGLGFGAVAPLPDRSFRSTAGRDHAKSYRSFGLRWNEPTDWDDFTAWLEGLLLARGDSILRMKGIVQVAGRDAPVVVQGVQHALYPPRELAHWPHAPNSELVFVTREFSREAALRSFREFLPYCVTVA